MSIIRISEYVWDRGTHNEIPGVRLRNKVYGGFVFLPLTELVAVSDSLVDFIEQRENETTVKRDTTTNDTFDRLADN